MTYFKDDLDDQEDLNEEHQNNNNNDPTIDIEVDDEIEIWSFRSNDTFIAMVDKKFYDEYGEYGKAGEYYIFYSVGDFAHRAIWNEDEDRWEDDEL